MDETQGIGPLCSILHDWTDWRADIVGMERRDCTRCRAFELRPARKPNESEGPILRRGFACGN